MQTHGGYGFATEFDVERKWRETRLYRVAPISTNLIMSFVAQNVLGDFTIICRFGGTLT